MGAPAYDGWFDGVWGRYAFEIESAALARSLGTVEGLRVIDVGCGTGRFTREFEAAGAMVMGVDLDPGMLVIAGRRVRGRLVLADAHRLPVSDHSFDLAVAVTLCELAAQPPQVIAEMARVTRPGGRVVISTLNTASPWGVAHRRRLRRSPWDKARFLTPGQLVRLAEAHGSVSRHWALFAPGVVPGLAVFGPLLERLGQRFPTSGAFQTVVIERPL